MFQQPTILQFGENGDSTVLDLVIARLARFANPSDVRVHIRRGIERGILREGEHFHPLGEQFWLTEMGAAQLLVRLGTAAVDAAVDEVVRLYRHADFGPETRCSAQRPAAPNPNQQKLWS